MKLTELATETTAMADETADLALSLHNVSRSFPGVKALDRVELQVRRGEVHGVLGENGAGKSTLMAVASGALNPDEGTVWINGHELSGADPVEARERGLAIVRQEPALLPDLTVAENLYLGVDASRRPSPMAIQTWSEEVLGLWGASHGIRATDRVEELRPQQRFIVDICRAISQDPDVLVLDEPTEHLLRAEVSTLFKHVRAITAAGRSVVYISHRINEVKEITDRLTVLRNGRTVGTYDTAEKSNDDIVGLVIGRSLDVLFPGPPAAVGEVEVSLEGFATHGTEPLTIELRRGEIVGLAGIEGNGQRDLLRALAGLQHSSGAVTIAGRRVRRWSSRAARENGVVFLPGDRHHEGILPTLTVGENIAYRNLSAISTGGLVSGAAEARLSTKVVADYNVKTPSLDTPIESLSGGNQQKVLFGSALRRDPALFLVDEPTQGIDIGARSEIYRLMREAADAGSIVVMLSSDAVELSGVADRVLVFSRGRVIEDLSGEDVTERSITGPALESSAERGRVHKTSARATRWLAGDIAPLAILTALVVALAAYGGATSSNFLGTYNISGILALTAVLALVAFGQVLVLMTGGIDVSSGPVVGLVVNIASFYLLDGASWATQLGGWAVMILAALGVGLINWTLIEFVGLNPLIATLATYMAVQGVSFVLRPSPGGAISRPVLDGVGFKVGPIPVAFILVLAIALLGGWLLKKTTSGMSLRAVGSSEGVAQAIGIRPRTFRLGAYLGSSALAALAGVFYMAQTGTGDARGGVSLILLSITAAVVGGTSLAGGRGSFVGALLGAGLVQVIASLTVFLGLSSDWQYYLIGVLTLGAVVLYSGARRSAAVSSA